MLKDFSPEEQLIGVAFCMVVPQCLSCVVWEFGSDTVRGLKNNADRRKGLSWTIFWPLRHLFHPCDHDYV